MLGNVAIINESYIVQEKVQAVEKPVEHGFNARGYYFYIIGWNVKYRVRKRT